MIRINIIPILIAIANEYGNDELFRRLKNILNIDITYLIGSKTNLEYTLNKLIIKTEKAIYTIELLEDYYTFTKDYQDYRIINCYDYNKSITRKSAVFKTSDNELLVLDEIDENNIKNRRIVKTTGDDLDYTSGSFEKEELSYHKQPVTERYKYLEDESCKKKISKHICMPNNLYIYSYRNTIDSISRDYSYGYIESASCINTPQLLVPGRIREKNELLMSSIKTPFPNILIRGRNEMPKEETEIELYNITIYKIGYSLKFYIKTIYLPTFIQSDEENIINSKTSGQITIEDIDLLLEFINKNLECSYTNEIKIELNNIKNQLLISKRKRIPDLDSFDSKFMMYPDFEHLAFDVYTNLSWYEDTINKQVGKGNNETPPTLKKIN